MFTRRRQELIRADATNPVSLQERALTVAMEIRDAMQSAGCVNIMYLIEAAGADVNVTVTGDRERDD